MKLFDGFDYLQEYTVMQLLKIFELPLYVQKDGWTEDFYYRIDEIVDFKTKGVCFKNGKPHYKERSYSVFDTYFLVCMEPKNKFIDNSTN